MLISRRKLQPGNVMLTRNRVFRPPCLNRRILRHVLADMNVDLITGRDCHVDGAKPGIELFPGVIVPHRSVINVKEVAAFELFDRLIGEVPILIQERLLHLVYCRHSSPSHRLPTSTSSFDITIESRAEAVSVETS